MGMRYVGFLQLARELYNICTRTHKTERARSQV